MKGLKCLWGWLWSSGQKERAVNNAAEKLYRSMRVTAKCRYNASVRLQNQGRFAFFTTTALSLGLILVPLMQISGVKLAFESNVLSAMQIFLAVSVLVYSVVIGTARYDVRAETLTECGDKLKELIRVIEWYRENPGSFNEDAFKSLQDRYSDIVTDTENHSRSDYGLAVLEMRGDYCYTGLVRLQMWLISRLQRLIPYLVPMILLFVEVVFIADMVAVTRIMPKYLNGEAVASSKLLRYKNIDYNRR